MFLFQTQWTVAESSLASISMVRQDCLVLRNPKSVASTGNTANFGLRTGPHEPESVQAQNNVYVHEPQYFTEELQCI